MFTYPFVQCKDSHGMLDSTSHHKHFIKNKKWVWNKSTDREYK